MCYLSVCRYSTLLYVDICYYYLFGDLSRPVFLVVCLYVWHTKVNILQYDIFLSVLIRWTIQLCRQEVDSRPTYLHKSNTFKPFGLWEHVKKHTYNEKPFWKFLLTGIYNSCWSGRLFWGGKEGRKSRKGSLGVIESFPLTYVFIGFLYWLCCIEIHLYQCNVLNRSKIWHFDSTSYCHRHTWKGVLRKFFFVL